MSRFEIFGNAIQSVTSEMEKESKTLYLCALGLEQVKKDLDSINGISVSQSVDNVIANVRKNKDGITVIQETLTDIMAKYVEAEGRSAINAISPIFSVGEDKWNNKGYSKDIYKKKWQRGYKYDIKQKKWVKERGKEKEENDKLDVRFYGREYKDEVTYYEDGGQKWGGDIEYTYSLLNYDKKFGGEIGKDGLEFYIGSSFTALALEGEFYQGDSLLGVYGKGSAEIGKFEAEGKVAIGLEDGKLNIDAGAEVFVGAEASAEGGMKVLGTDIGVKGTVSCGFGVKAKVNFKGGKFKADLGATLGIGASVSIEVDVTGTIDAVVGKAESVINSVEDIADDVGHVIGKTGKALGKIGKAFSKLW